MQTPVPPALGRLVASNLAAHSAAQLSLAAVPIVEVLGDGVGALRGEAACLWLAPAGFALQLAVITSSPVRRLARLPVATPLA